MKTAKPAVVAVSGVKNSGKTCLVEKLVALLSAKGYRVAVIKHDGHSFQPDVPGTDTARALDAGAVGTAVFDSEKCMVVCRTAVSADDLIACFPDAHIILLEGMKNSQFPKIEVVRGAVSQCSVCDPATLLAVVTDTRLKPPEGIPVFGLNDAEKVADLIENRFLKGERSCLTVKDE